MAETIKIQTSINLIETTGTQVLFNEFSEFVPESWNSGKVRLAIGVTDKLLVENVSMIVLNATGVIQIKLGDTTAPVMNCKYFCYYGDPTNIYIGNSSSEDILVDYSSAKET